MPKTRPDGSPFTPDDHEYWNQPYVHQEFPRWLHRVSPTTADVPPIDPRMHGVTTRTEHDLTAQVDLVYQGGIVDTAEVATDLQAAG